MPYAILVSYRGTGKDRDWEPTETVYEDGSEAGAWVKRENSYAEMCGTRRRYKAIRITDDNPLAWRHREEKRLSDGTYQRCPWHEHYYQRGYGPTGLYEHIDPDDATKVRFVASHTDGMAGRYTSMTPGRFIKHYIEADPDPRDLDRWCASMGLNLTTSKLKIARTANEIYKVYTEGPHSCMAYKFEPTDGAPNVFAHIDRHPTAVYHKSDLAVAYITRQGDITARCLVWPKMKRHGRIYGDINRLLERLQENGYIENWNFEGARIRQLRTDKGTLILPYLDGEMGVIPKGKDWLVLTDKPHIIAKSPYGVALAESCNRCGASGVWLESYKDDEEDEPEYICAEGCK